MQQLESFKIERGFRAPELRGPKNKKYPFREMKVGESFFVSKDHETYDRVATASHNWGKLNGMKFTVRKVDGGRRCWRIA